MLMSVYRVTDEQNYCSWLSTRDIGTFILLRDKNNGAPGEIRTHDPQIRNLVLYPAELRAHRVAGGLAVPH